MLSTALHPLLLLRAAHAASSLRLASAPRSARSLSRSRAASASPTAPSAVARTSSNPSAACSGVPSTLSVRSLVSPSAHRSRRSCPSSHSLSSDVPLSWPSSCLRSTSSSSRMRSSSTPSLLVRFNRRCLALWSRGVADGIGSQASLSSRNLSSQSSRSPWPSV